VWGADGRRLYVQRSSPALLFACRNTGNSRAGNEERTRKLRQRIERGEWQNPARLHPPDLAKVAAGVSRAKRAAVAAGTWVSPSVSEQARAKLSRARKHGGALHSAIEKLGGGGKVADLTEEEQEAHRQYRAELRGPVGSPRREGYNAQARSLS
jgi:hypothetical protein